MSDLTTGGINFLKEETNSKFLFELNEKQMRQKLEKKYKEGYSDGRASIVGEFERLRAELHETAEMHCDGDYYLRDEWIDEYVNNHISKLKGENNETDN